MFPLAAKADNELSLGMRDYLSGKTATHDIAAAFHATVKKDKKETHLLAEHFDVITHPQNGRKNPLTIFRKMKASTF
jgi:hypothetical protein